MYFLLGILLFVAYVMYSCRKQIAAESFDSSVAEGCTICKRPESECTCNGKKYHVFKKPNYYGLGAWGYHYGEPYYARADPNA
jgi:hypothetical protein